MTEPLAPEDKGGLYEAVIQGMDQGFCLIEMIVDSENNPIDYRFLKINPAFGKLLGLGEVIGKTVRGLWPETESFWIETYGKVALTGEAVHLEHSFQSLGGVYEVFAVPVGGKESRKVAVLFNDITERKGLEERLRQAAFYDALTGLPRRTFFMERLAQALAGYKRDPHMTFALLFLDLDNFKTVNDTLGHLAGDETLVEVAKRLRLGVREADTVARLGGDEFLVLLEGLASQETARAFAERLVGDLAFRVGIEPKVVEIRASVGLAFPETSDLTPQEVLTRADAAMYQSKLNRKT